VNRFTLAPHSSSRVAAVNGSARIAQEPIVHRLPAGGNRIRTIGPAPAKGSSGRCQPGDAGYERRSHLQVQARDGNACLEWLGIAFPFAEGPPVGIRLPPPPLYFHQSAASRGRSPGLIAADRRRSPLSAEERARPMARLPRRITHCAIPVHPNDIPAALPYRNLTTRALPNDCPALTASGQAAISNPHR